MKIGVEHRATKLPFASLLSSDGYARYGRPLCLRSSIVDQKPQKNVDLDRCTCWAGMRKRWRNTSPYPCVHHPCPSVHGQPNALTCLRAWMHQPLLSWVVYVRAHQITLACLHAPGGPAVSRRTVQLEIEHCLEFLNGYRIVQEVYRPSGIRRALHKSLFETRSTWQRTTFVLTNS